MNLKKNINYLLCFVIYIFFAFTSSAQKFKISGDWRLIGKTNEKFTINEFFETYPKQYDFIKNFDSNNYNIFRFKKNGYLLEDYGTIQALWEYQVDILKNKLILTQKLDFRKEYDIILLNKTDLILFEKKTETFFYLIKISRLKKRLKTIDQNK